jgi:peptidoglycan hydrolase-like protein with peptidoglycan-binding domain
VFVLAGAVPMYRTIGPGTKGPDVKQLQEGLGRLGYLKSNADGVFGAGTVTAVQKWYQAKGYTAQEPTTAQTRELHTLQEAVQSATQAQLQAQTAAAAGGGDRKLLDLKLEAAEDSLANARSDLDKYQNHYGTSVPAGEVAFLPSLPVRMTDVAVKAGQNVDGKVATVTSSILVIQANVTIDDAGLLRENMKATVSTTDGKTTAGTVTAIGDKARLDTGETPSKDQKNDNPTAPSVGNGGDPAPGGAVPVLVSLDDPSTLANQDKAPVTVSVAVGSTADKVLVVPVSAVVTGADATSRLEVDRGAGRTEDVPVTVGLAAGGYVQVTPSGAGLREGDRVVVGLR